MEIENYINTIKKTNKALLKLLEADDDDQEIKFYELIDLFENIKIEDNRNELNLFLQLVLQITENHHRQSNFYETIDRIIQNLQKGIQKHFTNEEKFKIFKRNKRILLFLIKSQMIIIDKKLVDEIKSFENYSFYFFTDIKNFLSKKEIETISTEISDDFENNRLLGENDSYISYLIRNDSVEDFIAFVNLNNLSLSRTTIKKSIFETNSFLIDKEPTLIEYAAFYGSIQIFQYLNINKVKLNPSLWFFVIHGNNPDLIHILEDNHVNPESFEKCYEESIKCHHYDLAKYFESNYCQNQTMDFASYYIKYYNFEFFHKIDDYQSIFCDLCYFNYASLVELLLKFNDINVNVENKNILKSNSLIKFKINCLINYIHFKNLNEILNHLF